MKTYYDTTGQGANNIMVIEADGRRYTASTAKMKDDWDKFKHMVKQEQSAPNTRRKEACEPDFLMCDDDTEQALCQDAVEFEKEMDWFKFDKDNPHIVLSTETIGTYPSKYLADIKDFFRSECGVDDPDNVNIMLNGWWFNSPAYNSKLYHGADEIVEHIKVFDFDISGHGAAWLLHEFPVKSVVMPTRKEKGYPAVKPMKITWEGWTREEMLEFSHITHLELEADEKVEARLKTRRDKSDKASTMYQLSSVVESLEGDELFVARYWPDSPKSGDAADAAVMDFCERHKIHIVEEDGYDVSGMHLDC